MSMSMGWAGHIARFWGQERIAYSSAVQRSYVLGGNSLMPMEVRAPSHYYYYYYYYYY
jgi:hypothetical protein